MPESDNPYTAPSSAITQATDDIGRQMEGVQWPLQLSFKVLALASQATVTDANGKVVLYTKQKMFKFREHVEIYTDKSRSVLLAEIKANKVIDWSARYNFTDGEGKDLGSVGRRGWRSIWKAHYEVFEAGSDTVDYSIKEESAMAKVLDGIFGQIPIIGFFTGYVFHPSYGATNNAGEISMRLEKKPAFWEGRFQIEKAANLSPREELKLILAYMMMVMLERKRG